MRPVLASFALSNYDLRQLRIFLKVVECGGVSAAAYRLGLSLSTVSRDLSALEKRLGIHLCRRGRSGFTLTPQGEDVHRAAVRLFSELQSFEQTIQTTRQTLGGGFNLGIIDNVVTNPEARIVAAIREMHRLFPDMLINVSVHAAPMIEVQVRERRIDIGVTAQPERLAPLEYAPAFVEEHRLYMSARSPHLQATRRAVCQQADGDGAGIPYISRDFRTDSFHDFEWRYKLDVVARASTLESILAAALAGIGCALLPAHFVRTVGESDLVEIATPCTPLPVQFFYVFRRDAANRRAIDALLNAFRG